MITVENIKFFNRHRQVVSMKGVVALQDIPAMTIVGRYPGRLLHIDEYIRIPNMFERDAFSIQTEFDNRILTPFDDNGKLVFDTDVLYINEPSEYRLSRCGKLRQMYPNCSIAVDYINRHVFIVSFIGISKGSSLLWYYSNEGGENAYLRNYNVTNVSNIPYYHIEKDGKLVEDDN